MSENATNFKETRITLKLSLKVAMMSILFHKCQIRLLLEAYRPVRAKEPGIQLQAIFSFLKNFHKNIYTQI